MPGLKRGGIAVALTLGMAVAPLSWAMAEEPTAWLYLPLGLRAQRMDLLPGMPSLTPSATPSRTPRPTATATATPTSTATASPTPTATSLKPLPEALALVNAERALAGLGPVMENADWSRGGELHARYMVANDLAVHGEDAAKPFFSAEGDAAGRNGNIFVGSRADTPARAAIDFWVSAPFHQLAVLDPELAVSGFGEHREAGGTWAYGAVLDVARGRQALAEGFPFPVRYPGEGRTTRHLRFGGNEWPDPLPGCPGFTAPTGAPILLMVGDGGQQPGVTFSALVDAAGGQWPHCVLTETTYKHPDAGQQATGRLILDGRDAVVLLPRAPLRPATDYRVTIIEGGRTHSWGFRTAAAGFLSGAQDWGHHSGGRPSPGAWAAGIPGLQGERP